MNRSELLKAAEEIITKDRHNTYGDAENNLDCIASLWREYLGITISTHDVAVLMILLKIARIRNSPGHSDSWIDIAGYCAIGAELATINNLHDTLTQE